MHRGIRRARIQFSLRGLIMLTALAGILMLLPRVSSTKPPVIRISDLALSPDGSRLAIGVIRVERSLKPPRKYTFKGFRLFEVHDFYRSVFVVSGKVPRRFTWIEREQHWQPRSKSFVNRSAMFAFQGGSEKLAVLDCAGLKVRVVDVDSQKTERTITVGLESNGPLRSVCFSGDGNRIAGNANYGPVGFGVWDLSTGKFFPTHANDFRFRQLAAIDHAGESVAVLNRGLEYWDVGFAMNLNKVSWENFQNDDPTIAISPSGKRLAFDGPAAVQVIDSMAGTTVARLPTTPPCLALQFTPDNSAVAIASENSLRIVNLDARSTVRLTRSGRSYSLLSFSADGSLLAAGGVDHTVDVIDTRTGEVVQSISIPIPWRVTWPWFVFLLCAWVLIWNRWGRAARA